MDKQLNILKIMIKTISHKILNDSLYRNSTFLLASNFILAGFGMLFWGINARLFTVEQIGLATTIISTGTLITVFALMGLNVSLIRYLPSSDQKNDLINASLTIVGLTSIIITLFFFLGLNYFFPKLMIITENYYFMFGFILLVVFNSLSELIKNIFRAYLCSEFVLLKNTLLNLSKLILILIFIPLGTLGIFSSWTVSLIIAATVSLFILSRKFNFRFRITINKNIVKKLIKFSSANYLSELFERTPSLILPMLITQFISSSQAAFFYIDMTLASFLYLLPEAISNSFFAESSANEQHIRLYVIKVIKVYIVLLIPAVLFMVFLGKYLLLFFGKDYSDQGGNLLSLLALSAIFIAMNSVMGNIIRIKFQMSKLVLINLTGVIIILGLSYLLLQKSIMGVGWAWLIGQGIMTLAYLVIIFRYKFS